MCGFFPGINMSQSACGAYYPCSAHILDPVLKEMIGHPLMGWICLLGLVTYICDILIRRLFVVFMLFFIGGNLASSKTLLTILWVLIIQGNLTYKV